jgi:hypothetical protein
MELVKVNQDNATLQVEYSRLVQEQEEAKEKARRLKNATQEVYRNLSEIPMEVDTPFEVQVMKIDEAI